MSASCVRSRHPQTNDLCSCVRPSHWSRDRFRPRRQIVDQGTSRLPLRSKFRFHRYTSAPFPSTVLVGQKLRCKFNQVFYHAATIYVGLDGTCNYDLRDMSTCRSGVDDICPSQCLQLSRIFVEPHQAHG